MLHSQRRSHWLFIPLLWAFATALPADTTPADFLTAQTEFDRGVAGSDAALDKAYTLFEKLLAEQPGHPLYLAYLGSATTLKGRAAWMPWNKMKYVEQGLHFIDKGLAQLKPEHDQVLLRDVPVSIETRLVAISTFLGIPGFFNRFDSAKELLQSSLADPAFAATPPTVQASFYWQASQVARQDKKTMEERGFLDKVLALAPHSDLAPSAQQRLKELAP